MRKFTALLLMGLLTGCSVNAPQSAQYNAEYSQRQDIRTQNVYRFKIKPLQPSGGKYWGADNLTQVFYVSDKNAATIELRFNFPTATLQASSLDEQGKVVSTQTFALLAESATPPSGSDTKYLYLTKSGELLSKWKNCTPDMSVGCSWGGTSNIYHPQRRSGSAVCNRWRGFSFSADSILQLRSPVADFRQSANRRSWRLIERFNFVM